MIDTAKEEPILLREFGKLLPDEKSYETVRSWWKHGRWNRDVGKKVRLETIRLTTGRCTTMEAYRRFIEQLNFGSEHELSVASPPKRARA